MSFDRKTVLVTGGSGTFGNAFIRWALKNAAAKKLIVFSRDEYKQHVMRQECPQANMRFFIGDVRDHERLKMAFRGVEIVIHAAALKHVPSGQYNPIEVIKTNVLGAQNVITAAIECGVGKVIALSTDKAVNPINLYGASKRCAESLFIDANVLSGENGTRFSCVRYGNVANSRGSVIPFFREIAKKGLIPITHPDMTRFMVTIEEAVDLVERAERLMQGGEIFVLRCPSVRIAELARAIGGTQCDYPVTGIRSGEKLHETLISREEMGRAYDMGTHIEILPDVNWFERQSHYTVPLGCDPPSYASDTNSDWIAGDELPAFLERV